MAKQKKRQRMSHPAPAPAVPVPAADPVSLSLPAHGRGWTNEHPFIVTVGLLVGLLTLVTAIITCYTFVRDDLASPTHLLVESNSIKIVNRENKVRRVRSLSTRQDWSVYKVLPDASTEEATTHMLVGMGSRVTNENDIALFDKELNIVHDYKFRPDSPIRQIQEDLQLNSLTWINHNEKRYVIAIFFGVRFPAAAVVLDDTLTEVGRFWHAGHLYGVVELDGVLYFWGKNNMFNYHRDRLPQNRGVDVMTLNHIAVFGIRFESILGGIWLGPRGERNPPPPLPVRPTPRPPFAFYYLLDSLTDQYEGL